MYLTPNPNTMSCYLWMDLSINFHALSSSLITSKTKFLKELVIFLMINQEGQVSLFAVA